MHPHSKHRHLLDYVLVHRYDVKDVLHTRVMPSTECHTDRRLVPCKLNLQFKPKPKKSGPRGKKLNISDLRSAEVKAKFQAGLKHKLEESTCTTVPSPETLIN